MECITGWGQERGGSHSTCPLGTDRGRRQAQPCSMKMPGILALNEYVRCIEGRRVLDHQVKLPGGSVGGREGGRRGKGIQGEGLVQTS